MKRCQKTETDMVMYEEWENYISKMLKHVRFRPDKSKIRREYTEHIEDMYDDYIEEGMCEEEAKIRVIDSLGDPDEAGRLLNTVHNPIIGWIWQAAILVVIAAALLSLTPIISYGRDAISASYDYISGHAAHENEILWKRKINQQVKIDSTTVSFNEVIYHGDGKLEVRYRISNNPFNSEIVNHDFKEDIKYFDEYGNMYGDILRDEHGSWLSGRVEDIILKWQDNGKMLIIEYSGSDLGLYNGRNFRITVPLS